MSFLVVAQAVLYGLYQFLYYLLYPLLLLLSPVFHLGRYALHVALVPFQLLVKFETLYIFLGVAAVIGIVTGSLLHLSSTTVISALNLQPSLGDEGEYMRPSSPLKPHRKQLQLRAKPSGAARSKGKSRRNGGNSERVFLEMDWGMGRLRRGGTGGLFSQVILEEDDNSEEGF
ncbi:MAG: hypothetical protein M1840_004843 [Geoglossum simile]|nr:MAG: hypothetical protein M1840_004843 [Geoglossum simile]